VPDHWTKIEKFGIEERGQAVVTAFLDDESRWKKVKATSTGRGGSVNSYIQCPLHRFSLFVTSFYPGPSLLSINLRDGQKPLHIICASRGFEFLCQHLSSPRCKRFPPKIIKACRLQLDFQAEPLVIPSSYLHKGRIACVLIFQSITTYHNTISNIFPLADVGS